MADRVDARVNAVKEAAVGALGRGPAAQPERAELGSGDNAMLPASKHGDLRIQSVKPI